MRRAPIVLTGTAVGLAGVLSFHPRAPEVTGVAPATASAAPATSTPAPSSSSGGGTKTVTGNAISTQYGNAQVSVTISSGKITDIKALQLQADEPKSAQISGYAAPILRTEALKAQSAAVDTVSGATVTSASYEQSLQSALDKAGFKAATRATIQVPTEQDHGGPGDGGPGMFGP